MKLYQNLLFSIMFFDFVAMFEPRERINVKSIMRRVVMQEGSSRRKRIKSSTEVFASQRKAKLRRSKTQLNTKQPKLRKVYCYLTPKVRYSVIDL